MDGCQLSRVRLQTCVDRRRIEILKQFVTERRYQRLADALPWRTRYLTVLVEDVFQPHNASAVLRSCDAFGVQDVHIVENRNAYRVNPGVELGTSQWLTLHRYRNTAHGVHNPPTEEPAVRSHQNTVRAVEALRRRGYRVVATTPHRDKVTPDSFDLSAGPAAVCFGAEMEGLSDYLLREADEYLKIPMHGFVESLNISVSAAITLYRLTTRLHESDINWQISPAESDGVFLQWLRASVRHWELIEARAEAESRLSG